MDQLLQRDQPLGHPQGALAGALYFGAASLFADVSLAFAAGFLYFAVWTIAPALLSFVWFSICFALIASPASNYLTHVHVDCPRVQGKFNPIYYRYFVVAPILSNGHVSLLSLRRSSVAVPRRSAVMTVVTVLLCSFALLQPDLRARPECCVHGALADALVAS